MDTARCLELIELYKERSFLWNSKDTMYHNKNKREDAWGEISKMMQIPVPELKAKMKTLMGTQRSERSKEKKYEFGLVSVADTRIEIGEFQTNNQTFVDECVNRLSTKCFKLGAPVVIHVSVYNDCAFSRYVRRAWRDCSLPRNTTRDYAR
ncbi:hypothetical protein WA026_008604 [Henosepilachna vigintioctopunctata]|uniref:MADF domain-containing protein n=1 Tax=Henosepilachna vigintioctopunctata TaxID=420089 RepID=A0AAW1UBQ6_9CUCU